MHDCANLLQILLLVQHCTMHYVKFRHWQLILEGYKRAWCMRKHLCRHRNVFGQPSSRIFVEDIYSTCPFCWLLKDHYLTPALKAREPWRIAILTLTFQLVFTVWFVYHVDIDDDLLWWSWWGGGERGGDQMLLRAIIYECYLHYQS